jgi:chromate transporter
MPRMVGEVARVFLKLGVLGFGGPAAHLALMEEEVVTKRKWIDREHLLDLAGLVNLVPGPNSTELAIHLGYVRAGWRGLLVAGACFLLPAVVLTTVFAVAYTAVDDVARFTYGLKPAVLAVIVAAGWRLGKTAVKGAPHAVLGAAVAVAVLLGAGVLTALAAGAVVGTLVLGRPERGVAREGVSLVVLGLLFLKVGAVLYGSGYVLVAFLERDLVEARGWLTQPELLDAIAVGQFTPGPVLSTAAFIGYRMAGAAGAAIATVGVFLPSFVFVALLGPWVQRLRASPRAASFLDAVKVAAVALLVAVLIRLAEATLVDPLAWSIAIVATVAAVRFKVGAMWLLLGGAAAGLVAAW